MLLDMEDELELVELVLEELMELMEDIEEDAELMTEDMLLEELDFFSSLK